MKLEKYTAFLTKQYFLTITVLVLIMVLARLNDLSHNYLLYYQDILSIVFYLYIGHYLSIHVASKVINNKLASPIMLSFIYYFSAFATFSDGNFAGWSHTGDILNKFVHTIIVMLISGISIFIPMAILAIASLYCVVTFFINRDVHNAQHS